MKWHVAMSGIARQCYGSKYISVLARAPFRAASPSASKRGMSAYQQQPARISAPRHRYGGMGAHHLSSAKKLACAEMLLLLGEK